MSELEKMLEEINNLIEEYMSGYVPRGMQDFCAGMKKAQEIIRKHMSGKDTDVPVNDGWIPVEDRLPDDGDEVLCSDGQNVFFVEYEEDWDPPFGDIDGIIAWMPLPEPYRPETAI